jgi:hypothetical protein
MPHLVPVVAMGALTIAGAGVAAAPAGALTASSGWTQADGASNGCTTSCPSSPPARAAAALAYDQQTSQLVLFGGLGPTQDYADFNDTWTWNGTSWTQVDDGADPGCGDPASQCSSSPPLRAVASMAYDPTTDQLVLFGGQGAGSAGTLNDTWVWNGSVWAQVDDSTDAGCGASTNACPSSPPGRSGAAMAYDQASGQLVLFGGLGDHYGELDDTWTWNGSEWTQVDDADDPGCTTTCTSGTSSPVGSVTPVMAYDQASDQLVLFGGDDYSGNSTWVWSGTTWTQVDDAGDPGCTNSCSSSPPSRSGGGFDYDPALGALVLFGGLGSGNLNDTWAWNGSAWSQIDDGTDAGCSNRTNPCPSSPPTRSAFTMANDPASNQLVVFGGQSTGGFSTFLQDTWFLPSAPTPTVTTVNASPDAVTQGQSVSYSATVTSSSGTPSGTVAFTAGATPLCTATLAHGSATCDATSAPLGTDTVTGSYGGDPTHAASVGTATLTVTSTQGYRLVGSDGGVYSFGSAGFFGSLPGLGISTNDIVGTAADPAGTGYWLVGSDGGVFSFGSAGYFGSLPGVGISTRDIVGMAADPAGTGYWLVGSDGGVYSFGSAASFGSVPGVGISTRAIVGMAADPAGTGYWLVGSDGGIYSFGSAGYFGSVPGVGISIDNADAMAATA